MGQLAADFGRKVLAIGVLLVVAYILFKVVLGFVTAVAWIAVLVLAALDRVAKQQEPETFGVFCTTDSWWLLDRLRRLGFQVYWPSWVMSSVPLPGLDRYLPTRPARLL